MSGQRVVTMEFSEPLAKSNTDHRRSWLKRISFVAGVLFGVLVVSVIFHIIQVSSISEEIPGPSTIPEVTVEDLSLTLETDHKPKSPHNHVSYPYSLKYTEKTPLEVNISCSTCPPWASELLRLNHLVRLFNQTDPDPWNIMNRKPVIESEGTVEMHYDAFVIKLVHKSVTKFPRYVGLTRLIRYDGFANRTFQSATAEDLSYEEKREEFEQELIKYLSRFFVTFEKLLSLDSVLTFGGTRPGQSEWGKVVLRLNNTVCQFELGQRFLKMDEEVKKMCNCSEAETGILVIEEHSNVQRQNDCDGKRQISPMFQPILDLLGDPCRLVKSKGMAVEEELILMN